jgi:hypothetical protein
MLMLGGTRLCCNEKAAARQGSGGGLDMLHRAGDVVGRPRFPPYTIGIAAAAHAALRWSFKSLALELQRVDVDSTTGYH